MLRNMMNGVTPERTMLNGISAGAAPPSSRAIYEQRKQYGRLSVNVGEISQYNVEHLTTFAIERKDGLLTVDDGIRKLKLLDARGKIWIQEALMQVDEKAVKLFDQNTQEELEDFPLSSIQHVQIVLDADPYSIIALVIKDSDQKTPDMHLYHCPIVPADVVGADVESALADCKDKKGRKIRPETLSRTRERVQASVIPPPPQNPPPAPPTKDGRNQNWDNIVLGSDFQPNNSEYSELPVEVLAQKINQDVQILNHTLDGIESFVANLQKSAEAMKELSHRKGSKRSKSKKKMAGDGMLTLRSKLPPQDRFLDCYCKFKLAYNLLAKLKGHIQNPNAVEIVHFLFSPLEMCVRACGGFDIPRSVESPLLTREAIDLLRNCLTTHEADVWTSLGDFWTKSREEFPKEHWFPPYVPQFQSSLDPPPLRRSTGEAVVDHTKELAATIAQQAGRMTRADEVRRVSDPDAFRQHVEQHVQRNQNVNNNAAKMGARGLLAQPVTKMCRSMYDFIGRNKNELNVGRDELLEVLADGKAWWKVQNQKGETGFVPGNHMVLISHHKSPSSSSSDGPISPVVPAAPPIPVAPLPPPPPPLPIVNAKVTPVPVSPRRDPKPNMNGNGSAPRDQPLYAQMRKPIAKNMSMDRLQEELKGRVNTKQAQQRNFSIPKKKANSSSHKVTEKSTSTEVKRWLESLGFSQLTIDSLGVLNGAQLFTLTKEELKMVCEEEGARVHSQLLVQKSFLKNNDKGSDQLAQILKAQKEKVDGDENNLQIPK